MIFSNSLKKKWLSTYQVLVWRGGSCQELLPLVWESAREGSGGKLVILVLQRISKGERENELDKQIDINSKRNWRLNITVLEFLLIYDWIQIHYYSRFFLKFFRYDCTCLKFAAFCSEMVGPPDWSPRALKLTARDTSVLEPSGRTVILILCERPMRFFTVDLSRPLSSSPFSSLCRLSRTSFAFLWSSSFRRSCNKKRW